MVVVDRRRTGALTLGEFTEFLQTLVEVARTYDSPSRPRGLFSDDMTQSFNLNDMSDSLFTFLRDLRYGIYVLKKKCQRKVDFVGASNAEEDSKRCPVHPALRRF